MKKYPSGDRIAGCHDYPVRLEVMSMGAYFGEHCSAPLLPAPSLASLPTTRLYHSQPLSLAIRSRPRL